MPAPWALSLINSFQCCASVPCLILAKRLGNGFLPCFLRSLLASARCFLRSLLSSNVWNVNRSVLGSSALRNRSASARSGFGGVPPPLRSLCASSGVMLRRSSSLSPRARSAPFCPCVMKAGMPAMTSLLVAPRPVFLGQGALLVFGQKSECNRERGRQIASLGDGVADLF